MAPIALAPPPETIFALATGSHAAAISVLRLSGPKCCEIVTALAGRLPAPRRATLRRLRGGDGALLDEAIILWMPGPRSYTGEDSAELHLHGGRAVLEAMTAALLALGARLAEPGEFTRRAFLNGRMDLLEAEGVGDLVAAETDAQRVVALRQLSGAQSAMLANWSDRLRRVLAWQEALIDFPDEGLPPETEARLLADIAALERELSDAIVDGARGMKLRDGLFIAVVGPPNAGKSSLVNALARREAAIVTPIAGTTRDAIEVPVDLAGLRATLVDTAGLRETTDPIEAEGIRRALQHAADADIVVHVRDAADRASAPQTWHALPPGRPVVEVFTKVDLAPPPDVALGVSAVTGAGMQALHARLADEARRKAYPAGTAVLTRARHVTALRGARDALVQAAGETYEELRGEALRIAMAELGRITGTVDADALLDTIFRDFCIGK